MQSFERYALVALLLLVVAIVATVAWDLGDEEGANPPATESTTSAADAGPARSGDLGVAPVQREPRTTLERKAPPTTLPPRADELAQRTGGLAQNATRESQVVTPPAPIVTPVVNTPTTTTERSTSGESPFVSQNTGPGASGSAGAGQAGSGLTGTAVSNETVRNEIAGAPPVVGLVPSQLPVAPPPTARPVGLPTGPLIVRKGTLGDQLAEEYGKDFRLFGPSGLVAAFEAANPGLDDTRLPVNAQLNRPPAARIEAARKSPVVAVGSSGAAPENTLPPGARAAEVVNVTPTVPVTARTHTVQPGETASHIAQLYFGRASAYTALEVANPTIDIHRIRVGQVLVVPASAGDVAAALKPEAAASGAPAIASNTTRAAATPRIK